jgi:hypothetical protein
MKEKDDGRQGTMAEVTLVEQRKRARCSPVRLHCTCMHRSGDAQSGLLGET